MAYIIFIQDARKGISYANGFEAGYLGKFGVVEFPAYAEKFHTVQAAEEKLEQLGAIDTTDILRGRLTGYIAIQP